MKLPPWLLIGMLTSSVALLLVAVSVVLLVKAAEAQSPATDPPEKKLPIAGEVFQIEGRTAFVIPPDRKPSIGATPWVWYAPTLPNLPGPEERWMFERFAKAGIAIAGIDVGESVAIFGGDLGYEFAREDQRRFQHAGYRIDDVRIDRAWIYGLVLNGSSDNVDRASRNHDYQPVRDPVHPGLDRPVIKNLTLRGGGDRQNRQGIYAVALTDGRVENMSIENFDIGVHVEDWVRGMHFQNTRFANNRKDTQIEGATEAATGVVFESR